MKIKHYDPSFNHKQTGWNQGKKRKDRRCMYMFLNDLRKKCFAENQGFHKEKLFTIYRIFFFIISLQNFP